MAIFVDPNRRQWIASFGNYTPWGWHRQMGGGWHDYPEHSGHVLALKKKQWSGLQYFIELLSPTLGSDFVIATVPSHDPENKFPGIRVLAARLAEAENRTDASGCLVRHTKIVKLTAGGDRSLTVHLRSIRVENAELIQGREVLLLDDVTTSGNSLLACRFLLLQAGAKSVQCVALARTG